MPSNLKFVISDLRCRLSSDFRFSLLLVVLGNFGGFPGLAEIGISISEFNEAIGSQLRKELANFRLNALLPEEVLDFLLS